MSTQYKLKTLQDMADVVTEDNVEVLANDIGEWLRFQVVLKMASSLTQAADVIDKNKGVMVWNDDGEKGISKLSIEIRKE